MDYEIDWQGIVKLLLSVLYLGIRLVSLLWLTVQVLLKVITIALYIILLAA